jgi:Transcriptional regulator, AbiEi antitoxin
MPNRHEIDPDHAIAELARRQHGIVTRAQLLGVGLGEAAIGYRCRHKRLFRVHLGVYAVGRPPAVPLEKASAAVLACGHRAALSHSSALSLWGFTSEWRFPLHVTAARLRRRPEIITHKAAGLTRTDIRTQLGIRVTSPARTFLDCAIDLGQYRLPRLAAEARRGGYLHVAQIADVLDRFRFHPGRTPLLDALGGLQQPTRSELEEAFLAFCDRHGLPQPVVNSYPWRFESDMLFAAEQVVVELDGWDFHRDKYAFESDRDRDVDLLAIGFYPIRITWKRLMERPEREARRLHGILQTRRRALARASDGLRAAASPASGNGPRPA